MTQRAYVQRAHHHEMTRIFLFDFLDFHRGRREARFIQKVLVSKLELRL